MALVQYRAVDPTTTKMSIAEHEYELEGGVLTIDDRHRPVLDKLPHRWEYLGAAPPDALDDPLED